MFEGCGADLTEDLVTRVPGNFGTLAHNVAASESGTRGVLYLSGSLGDDPENILLLCDTHHRLVDTVARADYPATTLSTMRRRFCRTATTLLGRLGSRTDARLLRGVGLCTGKGSRCRHRSRSRGR